MSILKLQDATARAEVTIKRKFHDIETKGERARKLKQAKIEAKKKRIPKGPISAEKIYKKVLTSVKDRRNQRRLARQQHLPKLKNQPDEAPVLLVIRNTHSAETMQSKETLRRFHLTQSYQAVFVKNNKETMAELKKIDYFIFYGYASAPLVRQLIIARAHIRLEDGAPIQPLNTNLLVEQKFGPYGLLSTEDLIHHIYTAGQHFDDVVAHLLPFQLESLRKSEGVAGRTRRGFQTNFCQLIQSII